jgi:hypothetical protein
MSNLTDSLALSFSFLNHLNAGYQAAFAALTYLREMGSSSISQEHFVYPVATLSKVSGWLDDLGMLKPLFNSSWTTPESAAAKDAYKAVEVLKQDLINWRAQLEYILGLDPYTWSGEQKKIVVSLVARVAYSQGYFLRGLATFAVILQAEDIYSSIAITEPIAKSELDEAHGLIKDEKSGLLFFRPEVLRLVRELPFRFNAQIHDLNVILTLLDRSFTYEFAGIDQKEAAQWAMYGLSPLEASQWRAFSFTPKEASSWISEDILNPAVARSWIIEDLTLEDAKVWGALSILPKIAKQKILSGEKPPPNKAITPNEDNLQPVEILEADSSQFPFSAANDSISPAFKSGIFEEEVPSIKVPMGQTINKGGSNKKKLIH